MWGFKQQLSSGRTGSQKPGFLRQSLAIARGLDKNPVSFGKVRATPQKPGFLKKPGFSVPHLKNAVFSC
jgi:hypothetical protein